MNENRPLEQTAAIPTSRWVIVLAWMIVTIPLTWGVYQSLMKSLPLFR